MLHRRYVEALLGLSVPSLYVCKKAAAAEGGGVCFSVTMRDFLARPTVYSHHHMYDAPSLFRLFYFYTVHLRLKEKKNHVFYLCGEAPLK